MLGSHYPTKLLIIDDGPDVRKLLRIIQGGTDLVCTATPDTVLASKIAVCDPPHLILMDTALQTGIRFLLLDWLCANMHTKDIPIIVATAKTTPGFDAWVHAKNSVKVLQKPCAKDVLLDLLQQVLEKQVRISGAS